MKRYQINEIFYSLQGEGVRAGTPNVFVRFSGCNLTCRRDGEAGFDCDTEFVSGRAFDGAQLHAECMDAVAREGGRAWVAWEEPWLILTGGEPALQVDADLVAALHAAGWKLAMETNGTHEIPAGIDWVCVSPKSAEHTLRVKRAHEVKYVRHHGQGIPRPTIEADHYLISPAFRTLFSPREGAGIASHEPDPGAMAWCIQLVKENPRWRLSVQQHKGWAVR